MKRILQIIIFSISIECFSDDLIINQNHYELAELKIDSGKFLIGKSEVAFSLWSTVFSWAVENGYSFSNSGIEYNFSDYETGALISKINWRDAIVFCNALTEYSNTFLNTQYDFVYYKDQNYLEPIKDSRDGIYGNRVNRLRGSIDHPFIMANTPNNTEMTNCIANGFRLPTKNEWIRAAAYSRGDEIDFTQPNSNGLYGMYDMFHEFCFDWYITGGARGLCGGNRGSIGFIGGLAPSLEYEEYGFRIAKNY